MANDRVQLIVTSFKAGSKRKDPSSTLKDIVWHTSKGEQVVGAIAKWNSHSSWQEYRVYYMRPEYQVTARATNFNNSPQIYPLTPKPNTQNSYVLMECFQSLTEANRYVKKHFNTRKTLKEEMFNVYVRLLQPLG